MAQETPQEILFTSLGTTVLDEIYVNGKLTAQNSPGGAAIFSALGARLFAIKPAAISLKIIAGEDLPLVVEQALRQWDISLSLQRLPSMSSTRAELRYADATLDSRDFKYLTPVLQPKPSDLQSSPILTSKVFHMLSTPQEVPKDVEDLLALRLRLHLPRPLIIWEPRPTSCILSNLCPLLEAIKHVDIVSPNHVELLTFFGEPTTPPFSRIQIEVLAQVFVDSGVGHDNDGIVLIRCANHGAMVRSRTIPATWVPAYWTSPADNASARHPEVVDTTGAGNCFLGGFAMGLLETGDPIVAASYGAVSSSFVVQQLGLPRLERCRGDEAGVKGDEEVAVGEEQWNGARVRDRLEVHLRNATRGVWEDLGLGVWRQDRG